MGQIYLPRVAITRAGSNFIGQNLDNFKINIKNRGSSSLQRTAFTTLSYKWYMDILYIRRKKTNYSISVVNFASSNPFTDRNKIPQRLQTIYHFTTTTCTVATDETKRLLKYNAFIFYYILLYFIKPFLQNNAIRTIPQFTSNSSVN